MYKIINESVVQRVADGHYIPKYSGNKQWLEYLEWLADGNAAEPPPDQTGDTAVAARALRDELLRSSDWTQLSDASESVQLAWVPYRNALRDLTTQPGFPDRIEWPVPPTVTI
ncbi:hypothetical protein D3C87_792750 [compost metagenome]